MLWPGIMASPLTVKAVPGTARLITFSQSRWHHGGNRQPEQGLSPEQISGRSPRGSCLNIP